MDSEWLKLVRLELGSSLINAYTSSRGFLEPAPPRGNLLDKRIGERQEALKRQGILLPYVFWKENTQLAPRQFKIICGISRTVYDGAQADILDTLELTVRQYALQSPPTPEVVKGFVEKGNTALSKEKYVQALSAYDKAYYWALVVNQDVLEDFITTVYNIGYIYFLNKRFASAIHYCSILQEIVDREDYPDPTIRYRVHLFYANVLWADRKHSEALELFRQAAEDVSAYTSTELRILALWDVVCASFSMELATEAPCRYALIALREIIAAGHDRYPREELNRIASLYEAVAERKIKALESERQRLDKRCAELEKELSGVALVGTIVQNVSGVLLTVSALLPRQITILSNVGNLIFSNNRNSRLTVDGSGVPKP